MQNASGALSEMQLTYAIRMLLVADLVYVIIMQQSGNQKFKEKFAGSFDRVHKLDDVGDKEALGTVRDADGRNKIKLIR